jgi:hypothetical protein
MSELVLGDRVTFTGTVVKNSHERWRGIVTYEDAPLPAFLGHNWVTNNEIVRHPVAEGIVVGKRHYVPMENDEGIWSPSYRADYFTGYLVAYHLARNPVIVRLDQITHINEVAIATTDD